MPAADPLSGPRVLGIDVGGTAIKAVVLGPDGSADYLPSVPTPRADGPDVVVTYVLDTVEQFVRQSGGIEAVGLVVPGFVNDADGIADYSENIGWRDVPFRRLVAERTGLPVGFGHDVRAAGEAEWIAGAAVGVTDVLFVPIGTGISGAIVAEGRPLHGATVGEIGHLDVGSGRPCACGGHGCLETVATGPAIAAAYAARTGLPAAGAREVFEAAAQGDEAAQAVLDSAIDALARALTAYVTILAPERIVIGGGVGLAGRALVDPLTASLTKSLVWQRVPDIVSARFGEGAAAIGAALLARRALTQPLRQPLRQP